MWSSIGIFKTFDVKVQVHLYLELWRQTFWNTHFIHGTQIDLYKSLLVTSNLDGFKFGKAKTNLCYVLFFPRKFESVSDLFCFSKFESVQNVLSEKILEILAKFVLYLLTLTNQLGYFYKYVLINLKFFIKNHDVKQLKTFDGIWNLRTSKFWNCNFLTSIERLH